MNVRLARNLRVSRASWALVALFAVGCVSVLGYSWATRAGEPVESEAPQAEVIALPATTDVPVPSPSATEAGKTSEDRSAQRDAAKIEQLIADTSSNDPQKRAEAITSLAKVPKPQAMPVLKRVLNHGEPRFDRPLAVRALRDLAIAQGDEDGSIQDALRYATYHDDDPDLISGAQAALDAIAAGE
jgi:HEAT repeat protein